ncbi:hypothetical protein GCM10010916_07410 [Paenibacillus abyssi]|uniref:Uncharacterized protein n=2 Tax=Paenibacillus abyssi TaxID=1340531 RepID=A0A917CNJ5_9BACL|nr:hypothetical protein GCM10010916_07410 [Paenibacillus abyssi]
MLELIFLGYCVLCAILLWIRHRRDRREWFMRLMLVICLPGAGWLLPQFWPKWLYGKNSKADSELLDVYGEHNLYNVKLTRIYQLPEAEKEMNIVPLEEALIVNDYLTRRRVIIDLLKQNTMEYIGVLQQAVRNEDTETSHYAVSAIMEIKRKLTLSMQELSVKYEEDAMNPHLLLAYADVLKAYMGSGFIDERTLTKHKHTYANVLKRLIEVEPERESAYLEKMDTDLELGDYASAEQTGRLYLERFPGQEEAYLALMKLYFTIRSYAQLQATLEALKRSPIRLSHRALALLRFWS